MDDVGIRAQDHILGLELSPRTLNGPRRAKFSLGVPIQSLIRKEQMENGLRRNSSSDMINAA